MRFLYVFLIVFANSAVAQSVAKIDFDKSVDYVNCRAVELSISKDKDASKLVNFKNKCNCDSIIDFNIITKAIDASLTSTKDLALEFNKVKENYKANINVETAIIFLTDSIFNKEKKYNKIYNFNKNSNAASIANYKTDIKTKLKNLLSKEPSSDAAYTENADSTKLKDGITLANKPLDEISRTNDNIFWVIFIALILSISFNIWLLYTIIKSIKHEKQQHNKAEYQKNESNSNHNLISEIEHLRAKLSQSNKRVENLEKEIHELRRLKDEQATNKEVDPVLQQNPSTVTSSPKIIFLGSPTTGGDFISSSSLTKFDEELSVYMFTLQSDKVASFKIYNHEDAYKSALKFPERIIYPVCNSENNITSSAKKIYTLKEGRAELEGDRWIVKEKAIIKYE